MGVAVLHPRDCLSDLFSGNNLASPHRHKKPVTNRRRRSPPRHQTADSPPPPPAPAPPLPLSDFVPKGSKKKNLNHTNNIVSSQVRILKRVDDLGKKIPDPAIEKPDLKSTRQIRSDPVMIPTQNRISHRRSMPASFYAGPVTSTSPPPSEVPLPAFFAKKTVSGFKSTEATHDLIRILKLDIA